MVCLNILSICLFGWRVFCAFCTCLSVVVFPHIFMSFFARVPSHCKWQSRDYWNSYSEVSKTLAKFPRCCKSQRRNTPTNPNIVMTSEFNWIYMYVYPGSPRPNKECSLGWSMKRIPLLTMGKVWSAWRLGLPNYSVESLRLAFTRACGASMKRTLGHNTRRHASCPPDRCLAGGMFELQPWFLLKPDMMTC